MTTTILSGAANNLPSTWTSLVAGGLSEQEIENFLSATTGATGAAPATVDITNFNYDTASGCWTFTLEGVNLKITPTSDVMYEVSPDAWSSVQAGDVKLSDGLSTTEATAFNSLLTSQGDDATDNGRTQGFQFRPRTLYQKMLYAISSQMNDMFLDILSMSTVLANGTGWDGIQLLAEKGITIDGTSISSMLADPVAYAAFAQYGGLIDGNVDIASITAVDGSPLTAGEQTIVRINFVGGGHSDMDLTNTDFCFVLTPPAQGQDWSIGCLDVKISESESILESPGTLFLIQQLLQQMKDSLQAIGAVGKVGGDVRTTAVQSFVRDMNG